MTTMADVAAEARSWKDTPFQHQQSMKGIACDCRGLVLGVARALGLVEPDFDINGYPRTPDGTIRATCDQHMTRTRDQRPGVVVLVRFGDDPQHLAILGDIKDGLTMIHSYSLAGRVVEHRLADVWRKRIVQAYVLPGVA